MDSPQITIQEVSESIESELTQLLSVYQSHATTADEIERSIECLNSTHEASQYLLQRTGRVATFFPLNLPIYSLVLVAIIPALMADQVFLRYPQKMGSVFRNLAPLLKLNEFLPNIHIKWDTREEFVQGYVADADVTIFTGKESNARSVLQKTKKGSLFLFNGWGCNPIVIASDANLDLAVKKTIEAKTFNSGQDCAGPDNILVQEDISKEFLALLEQAIGNVKVGSYNDSEVTVAPLADEAGLLHVASLLHKHRKDTVLVFFVHIYDNDDQLSTYFGDPHYAANEMYVFLFGSSAYVTSLQRSIVYQEKTILDVESGNSAYGGFSHGASFVATQGKVEARPILIPLEISRFFEKRSDNTKFSDGKCRRVSDRTRDLMVEVFGQNLVFGFVSGSVAKLQATTKSDIDNMVVLHKLDSVKQEHYVRGLRTVHEEMSMSFDEEYPTEILTLDQVIEVFSNIDKFIFDVRGTHFNQEAYDAEICINFLGGKKMGIVGDEALLLTFAKEAGKIGKGWKIGLLRELSEIANKNPHSQLLAGFDLKTLRKMDISTLMKTLVVFWLPRLG